MICASHVTLLHFCAASGLCQVEDVAVCCPNQIWTNVTDCLQDMWLRRLHGEAYYTCVSPLFCYHIIPELSNGMMHIAYQPQA